MAATITTAAIWNQFLGSHKDGRAFYHGHTFGGNPLAAAVALESLNIFQEEQLLAKTPGADTTTSSIIVTRIAKLPHVGDTRQCGLVAGIDLVADKGLGHVLTPGKIKWGQSPAWQHGSTALSYDNLEIRLSLCRHYQSALQSLQSFSMRRSRPSGNNGIP